MTKAIQGRTTRWKGAEVRSYQLRRKGNSEGLCAQGEHGKQTHAASLFQCGFQHLGEDILQLLERKSSVVCQRYRVRMTDQLLPSKAESKKFLDKPSHPCGQMALALKSAWDVSMERPGRHFRVPGEHFNSEHCRGCTEPKLGQAGERDLWEKWVRF